MALRDILIIPDKRLRAGVRAGHATSTRRARSWSTTCSRPCTPRRASGLPRSRSACRSASSPWTSPRRTTRRSRRSSSIRKSIWSSEETSTYEEGCLSIPEYYEEVERPAQVKVRYLDLDGKPHEIEADGLLATCLQHEIDHTQRRAVHRSYLQAQARHGDEEVQEGGQARRAGQAADDREPSHHIGVARDAASPRLHGYAGFRGADALSSSRRAGTTSPRSIRARRSPPAAAWRCRSRRSSARRGGSACRCSRRRR